MNKKKKKEWKRHRSPLIASANCDDNDEITINLQVASETYCESGTILWFSKTVAQNVENKTADKCVSARDCVRA